MCSENRIMNIDLYVDYKYNLKFEQMREIRKGKIKDIILYACKEG